MDPTFIWGDWCSTKSSATGLFQVNLSAIEAMYLFATPSATVDPLNSAGLGDCFPSDGAIQVTTGESQYLR